MIALLSNFACEFWCNSFWLLSLVDLGLLKWTLILRSKRVMLAKIQIKAKFRKRFGLILKYCVLFSTLVCALKMKWLSSLPLSCPYFEMLSGINVFSKFLQNSIMSNLHQHNSHVSRKHFRAKLGSKNRGQASSQPLTWFITVEKRMWNCKLAMDVLVYGWILFISFSIHANSPKKCQY